MSRIGRLPIAIPQGVKVELSGSSIVVQGPKGSVKWQFHNDMKVEVSDSLLVVNRSSDEPKDRALHGLTRSLIANMVTGVTNGFTKTLEIIGVGYRAEKTDKGLTFYLGYSNPVEFPSRDGIDFEVESPTIVHVRGIDKQLVGQIAADVRGLRPPEPYKGKGIRYKGEYVRQKAGKTAVV